MPRYASLACSAGASNTPLLNMDTTDEPTAARSQAGTVMGASAQRLRAKTHCLSPFLSTAAPSSQPPLATAIGSTVHEATTSPCLTSDLWACACSSSYKSPQAVTCHMIVTSCLCSTHCWTHMTEPIAGHEQPNSLPCLNAPAQAKQCQHDDVCASQHSSFERLHARHSKPYRQQLVQL